MNYLKYIEHDAENLQFLLWARAYIEKFNALPESEKRLSPEWTEAQAEAAVAHANAQASRQMKVSADTAEAMKGTGLDGMSKVAEVSEEEKSESNPFQTPPWMSSEEVARHGAPSELRTSEGGKSSGLPSTRYTTGTSRTTEDLKRQAEGAYSEAGMKWQPCEFPTTPRLHHRLSNPPQRTASHPSSPIPDKRAQVLPLQRPLPPAPSHHQPTLTRTRQSQSSPSAPRSPS